MNRVFVTAVILALLSVWATAQNRATNPTLSPNVSQRGRGAVKTSSIRTRSALNCRKSW